MIIKVILVASVLVAVTVADKLLLAIPSPKLLGGGWGGGTKEISISKGWGWKGPKIKGVGIYGGLRVHYKEPASDGWGWSSPWGLRLQQGWGSIQGKKKVVSIGWGGWGGGGGGHGGGHGGGGWGKPKGWGWQEKKKGWGWGEKKKGWGWGGHDDDDDDDYDDYRALVPVPVQYPIQDQDVYHHQVQEPIAIYRSYDDESAESEEEEEEEEELVPIRGFSPDVIYDPVY